MEKLSHWHIWNKWKNAQYCTTAGAYMLFWETAWIRDTFWSFFHWPTLQVCSLLSGCRTQFRHHNDVVVMDIYDNGNKLQWVRKSHKQNHLPAEMLSPSSDITGSDHNAKHKRCLNVKIVQIFFLQPNPTLVGPLPLLLLLLLFPRSSAVGPTTPWSPLTMIINNNNTAIIFY